MLKLIIIFFTISSAFGQKVKVEYKKYQVVDLGKLNVDGELLAPGDLTVRQTRHKQIFNKLFNKTSFRKNIELDTRFER